MLSKSRRVRFLRKPFFPGGIDRLFARTAAGGVRRAFGIPVRRHDSDLSARTPGRGVPRPYNGLRGAGPAPAGPGAQELLPVPPYF